MLSNQWQLHERLITVHSKVKVGVPKILHVALFSQKTLKNHFVFDRALREGMY